jgi:hypothetical protein
MPSWSPDRAPGCLSDLDLDELVAGDRVGLPSESAARRHISGCARCRERLMAFEAVEPPPAAALLPQVRDAVLRERRPRRWPLGMAVMAAGVAAAAVFALVARPGPGSDQSVEERTKGGLALTVFVKRAGGTIEAVTDRGTLGAGDEMRFSLLTNRPGYAVVLGLDSTRSVTLYAPYAATGEASQPTHLERAGVITLPGSIVADQAPGAERIVAVLCDVPTPPQAVRARAVAALDAAGGDPARVPSLGTGCRESAVLLHKESRGR